MRSSIMVLGLTLAIGTGCASVSPASVKLASETGARSAELGALHQQMVRNYFATERLRVETFLKERWEPQFLRNFLGETRILSLLRESMVLDEAKQAEIRIALAGYLTDTTEASRAAGELVAAITRARSSETAVVRGVVDKYVPNASVEATTIHVVSLINTHEPALLIMEFAADAHDAMEAQRKEMLEPINVAEQRVLAELSESYANLARAHGTITARLEAASRSAAQQDALLAGAGMTDPSKVREQLAGISSKIAQALQAASGLENPDAVAKTLKEKLNALF